MVVTMALFAAQDGISRYLAAEYNTMLIVMIRYWVFTGAILIFFSMRSGGLRRVARSKRPMLQFGRGLLLAPSR